MWGLPKVVSVGKYPPLPIKPSQGNRARYPVSGPHLWLVWVNLCLGFLATRDLLAWNVPEVTGQNQTSLSAEQSVTQEAKNTSCVKLQANSKRETCSGHFQRYCLQ